MTTVELGAENFESTVRGNDIVFDKVDTEAQRKLTTAAGITSIPTLMAFRDAVRALDMEELKVRAHEADRLDDTADQQAGSTR